MWTFFLDLFNQFKWVSGKKWRFCEKSNWNSIRILEYIQIFYIRISKKYPFITIEQIIIQNNTWGRIQKFSYSENKRSGIFSLFDLKHLLQKKWCVLIKLIVKKIFWAINKTFIWQLKKSNLNSIDVQLYDICHE